jgi:hypothetical protein
MAHFAELNDENKVLRVVVVNNDQLDDNGVESPEKGVQFLKNLYGQATIWKQTSYNTGGGVHELGGTPLRKNFASKNMTYDSGRDAFIFVKPYPSWTLNETTCLWDPPTPMPIDEHAWNWNWNESSQAWELGYPDA